MESSKHVLDRINRYGDALDREAVVAHNVRPIASLEGKERAAALVDVVKEIESLERNHRSSLRLLVDLRASIKWEEEERSRAERTD